MLNQKKLNTKVLSLLDSLHDRITPNISHSASSSAGNGADTFHDHYTASANGYLVGWLHVTYPSNATGRRATRCYVTTSGTRSYINIEDMRNAVNGTATGVTLPIVCYLNSGQILGVRVYQNSGAAQTVASQFDGIFVKDI